MHIFIMSTQVKTTENSFRTITIYIILWHVHILYLVYTNNMGIAIVACVVCTLIVCLLLLTAGICAITGAADAEASTLFNSVSSLRTAYIMLVIGGAVALTTLIALIVVLIIGSAMSGFKSVDSNILALASKTNPTADEYAATVLEYSEIHGHHDIQWFIAFAFILLTVITAIISILFVVSTVSFASVRNQDSKARSAHTASTIAMLASIVAMLLLVVSTLTYFNAKSERAKAETALESFHTTAKITTPVPAST